jgi:hypothetical protein
MDRTLGNGYLLLRCIGEDSEEAQHPNRFQRTTVKLIPAIDSGGVVPSKWFSLVSEDATNEMTVNVVTLIQSDNFACRSDSGRSGKS